VNGVFVHESSVVDPGAVVGSGTRIWHFCHVMPRARIGARCSLGQNVFVADDVVIGDNVKIQNNVSLYTGVHVEDDVFLGPSVVFTNVLNPRSHVSRKDEFRRTLVRRGASIGANATAAISPFGVSIHIRLNRTCPTMSPFRSATHDNNTTPSVRRPSMRSASSIPPNAASFTRRIIA